MFCNKNNNINIRKKKNKQNKNNNHSNVVAVFVVMLCCFADPCSIYAFATTTMTKKTYQIYNFIL